MKCKICGSDKKKETYNLREMMMGLRTTFKYHLCEECQCLQIENVPEDIDRYYPKDYYSFEPLGIATNASIRKRLIFRLEYMTALQSDALANLICRIFPKPRLNVLRDLPLNKNTRVLDIGCGSGYFLEYLGQMGLKNLTGLDPYVSKIIINAARKRDIQIVNEPGELKTGDKWDLIVYNHSFEHMVDPVKSLRLSHGLLSNTGTCMIRVPNLDSYAWRKYRENWVQLDPPRHTFIYSPKCMKVMAKMCGFIISKIVYDSTDFQFYGSELYVHDIPLCDSDPSRNQKIGTIIPKSEIKEFSKTALKLNQEKQGDQFAIFLKKA